MVFYEADDELNEISKGTDETARFFEEQFSDFEVEFYDSNSPNIDTVAPLNGRSEFGGYNNHNYGAQFESSNRFDLNNNYLDSQQRFNKYFSGLSSRPFNHLESSPKKFHYKKRQLPKIPENKKRK